MSNETDRYLDVSKSVIISAPAGSGKTEKLARRYIALLKNGADVEKILCITFTEKAAAEMKQRILNILRRESPEMYSSVKNRIPLMRISTIHAFCLKLLKRFSIELGLDPSLTVMDELEAHELWAQSVYDAIIAEKEMQVNNTSKSPAYSFDSMIKNRGLRGWTAVKKELDDLHNRKPFPEIILNKQRDKSVQGADAMKFLNLYGKCLTVYKSKKRENHVLDFSDLEILSLEALSIVPDWHNILYSFDEHTDHILVDEFQDTNTLQWKIIDKLTEEWRSGMGAKRESGGNPTIFLVGDEKQSIYLFRGANVSVFHDAKDRFSKWLGNEYHFIEARENYRCLTEIVDFTNALFEKLMPRKDQPHKWITKYAPFVSTREGRGLVELILLDSQSTTKLNRNKEALVLAEKIKYMHGRHEVYKEDMKRPCMFSDMAILLRKRTHLGIFEDALRKHDIPFVVLKGIGFYDEPEVSILREAISFLCDPADNYSLFCLLRSPLFNLDQEKLYRISMHKKPLRETLAQSDTKRLREISNIIEGWLERSKTTPIAELLEQVLIDTQAWSHFFKRQGHSNIKKFISLVESFEADGLSILEIREKLLRHRRAREVSKANINTEGMDAVKIMTIHAAKGLQFPMVFLPSMEEDTRYGSGPIMIEESDEGPRLYFEEDRNKRDKNEHFRIRKMMEQEEEKRLFYVAVTRTRDYLCMIGAKPKKRPTGRLSYLEDAFHFLGKEGFRSNKTEPYSLQNGVVDEKHVTQPFTIVTEDDLSGYPSAGKDNGVKFEEASEFMGQPLYAEPLLHIPQVLWRDVSEEADHIAKHGQDWTLTGSILHRLFEEISKGYVDTLGVRQRAGQLLRASGLFGEHHLQIVLNEIGKLEMHGILAEIMSPRTNSYAELPFILNKGYMTPQSGELPIQIVYRGRIDRVIINDGTVFVYDYKTYPVRKDDIEKLIGKYEFQMQTYKEAAERIFELSAKAYLVFTHMPRVVEV